MTYFVFGDCISFKTSNRLLDGGFMNNVMDAFSNLRRITLCRVKMHNNAFISLLVKSKCRRIDIYGLINTCPNKPTPKNSHARRVLVVLRSKKTDEIETKFMSERFPNADFEIRYQPLKM